MIKKIIWDFFFVRMVWLIKKIFRNKYIFEIEKMRVRKYVWKEDFCRDEFLWIFFKKNVIFVLFLIEIEIDN